MLSEGQLRGFWWSRVSIFALSTVHRLTSHALHRPQVMQELQRLSSVASWHPLGTVWSAAIAPPSSSGFVASSPTLHRPGGSGNATMQPTTRVAFSSTMSSCACSTLGLSGKSQRRRLSLQRDSRAVSVHHGGETAATSHRSASAHPISAWERRNTPTLSVPGSPGTLRQDDMILQERDDITYIIDMHGPISHTSYRNNWIIRSISHNFSTCLVEGLAKHVPEGVQPVPAERLPLRWDRRLLRWR